MKMMAISNEANLTTQVFHALSEIDAAEWDALSAGQPFQSYAWYRFGEQVMSDCFPTYILVRDDGQLVARAAFWLVRNEPLPGLSNFWRGVLMAIFHRWPLFICRSPLSNATGIIVSEHVSRQEIYSVFAHRALHVARKLSASFLVLDYLTKSQITGWPQSLIATQVSDPGTVMLNRWRSLDDFLAAGNKKDRQHYKRTLRETGKLGVTISYRSGVTDLESALELISNVDRRHENAPTPWMKNLLKNMDMVQGVWIEARIGDRLVGGGLSLEDSEAQMTTALALADDVPYVYFLLMYASLDIAFSHRVRILRWGSGAYDVKKQLGFELEENNYLLFCSTHPFLQKMGQILRRLI